MDFVLERYVGAGLMPEIYFVASISMPFGWLIPREKIFNVLLLRVPIFPVQPELSKRLWYVTNDIEILNPLCIQYPSSHKEASTYEASSCVHLRWGQVG